jgi:hypothetical protein
MQSLVRPMPFSLIQYSNEAVLGINETSQLNLFRIVIYLMTTKAVHMHHQI